MMRRDSHSMLSATVNADGMVSPVGPTLTPATKKNWWRHRHKAPGAVTLQTQLRTKTGNSPWQKAAKEMAVCSTNKALNFLGMLAPLAPEAVFMMYGQMSVLDVLKSGMPLLLTFIPAVVDGICGVKMMLTSSTLPGYLLMVLIMGSTPNIFIILAILSQFFGSFLVSLGLICLMLLQGHYLRIAALFSNRKLRSAKKLEEQFSKLRTQQTILMSVFYVCVVIFIGTKLYLLKTHGAKVSSALQGGITELFKMFKKPCTILSIIIKMRLSGLVSQLGSSDLALYMIFEVMDDDIKVKEKGLKADEATKKLVDDWHILISGKKLVRKSQEGETAEGVTRKSTLRRESHRVSFPDGSTGEAPISGSASAAFQGGEGAVTWEDSNEAKAEPATDKGKSSKKSKGEKKTKK